MKKASGLRGATQHDSASRLLRRNEESGAARRDGMRHGMAFSVDMGVNTRHRLHTLLNQPGYILRMRGYLWRKSISVMAWRRRRRGGYAPRYLAALAQKRHATFGHYCRRDDWRLRHYSPCRYRLAEHCATASYAQLAAWRPHTTYPAGVEKHRRRRQRRRQQRKFWHPKIATASGMARQRSGMAAAAPKRSGPHTHTAPHAPTRSLQRNLSTIAAWRGGSMAGRRGGVAAAAWRRRG